jgi:hypothetical protein
VCNPLSLDRPLWTANLLAKRHLAIVRARDHPAESSNPMYVSFLVANGGQALLSNIPG